jgi:dipeptidase E
MMRLLLVSSSYVHGGGYLDHYEAQITEFLQPGTGVLFFPYALKDLDEYACLASERFAQIGLRVHSIHQCRSASRSIERAEAIFVGGGNTFRLLTVLLEQRLLEAIEQRVRGGTPYIGVSAGANLACPTIMTTNDMPIVWPSAPRGLRLIPFQINVHYRDPDPEAKHMGETRETRIREFHEENDIPVVALREGSVLCRDGEHLHVCGTTAARLFRKQEDPIEVPPGSDLSFLLAC